MAGSGIPMEKFLHAIKPTRSLPREQDIVQFITMLGGANRYEQ